MGSSVIAFDDSLLTVGAVAVQCGEIVQAATFVHDTKKLRGVAKYSLIGSQQAADVVDFLNGYSREVPVIIELGANDDGTTWRAARVRSDGEKVPMNSRQIIMDGIATGICEGVAVALGFKRVEYVPVGRGGWGGKKNQYLAKALPGVELKTDHERDAAAMAQWWLARNGR